MIVYKGRLLKQSSIKNRSLSCQGWSLHHFKHCISYATYLVALFCCNRFRILLDIVSKLMRAAIWSRCAVQIESEQTPLSQRDCRFRSAALQVCTGFDSEPAVLILRHIFTHRPMTDWKIEQSDGRGFERQQLFPNSIENFISHSKTCSLRPEIYKALKPFWLLNWVSIARVAAYFPQASRSRPAATAANSETLVFVPARPSSVPPKLCWSAAPRAWPLISPLNLRLPLEQPSERIWEIARRPAGLKLGLKLELCSLTNEL